MRRLIILIAAFGSACSRHPHAATTDAHAVAASGPIASTTSAADAAHVSFVPTRIAQAVRPHAPTRTARANETVSVPAGPYHLGSTPGDLGRDPAVEADGAPVDVPAFDIDALPFPNDPAQPAQAGSTREQADAACHARGRRLCNEIEWERACRGPQETEFPGGDTWDTGRCAGRGDPGQCASGYGAMIMGARNAEWTASDLDQRAVIRGGPASGVEAIHRCASRRTALPTQPGLEVTFRCCGGAAPHIEYPRETSRPPFREEPMGVAQLAAIVATVPELERVRDGLAIFSPSAITEVLNHGATTAEQHPELHFSVAPVRWSPTFGEDLLVFTAMSTAGSFVAALWVLPPIDGHTPRYKHASSFILAGDRVSMALGYGAATREEVQWSACWNCGGEHGVIHYDRAEAHVVAVQR